MKELGEEKNFGLSITELIDYKIILIVYTDPLLGNLMYF
jgi:hypothetical protein